MIGTRAGRILLIGALLGAAGGLSACRKSAAPAAEAVPAAAKGIPWVRTYEEAIAEAGRSQKLVMVDFYTDWCGPCKMMDQQTFTDGKVIEAVSQFVPAKLNAEEEGSDAATRFGVTGYPTIMFITPEGGIAGQFTGFMDAPTFLQQVEGIAARERDLPKLEEFVRKNPKDPAPAARVAAIFAERGSLQKAEEYLRKAEAARDAAAARRDLAAAYQAVGRSKIRERDFTQALPLLQKALSLTREPEQRGATRFGIATCYLEQKNHPAAIRELQAVIKEPGVTQEHRRAAETILQAIQQQSQKPNG